MGLMQELIPNSALVGFYRQAVLQIEQEIQKKDQEQEQNGSDSTIGQTIHVTGYVNHTGSKTQYSSPTSGADFGDVSEADFSTDGNEMLTSDDIEVRNVLSQISDLSDVIVFDFGMESQIVGWIDAELHKHSPYKTGRYFRSHVILADGELITDLNSLPLTTTSEWTFVSTLPYSRKIEQGESSMAPNGVYEVVAQEAQQRYGGTWIINFIDYAGTLGGMVDTGNPNVKFGHRTKLHMNRSQNRYPAISVRTPNR